MSLLKFLDNIPKLQSLLHNALFDAMIATWYHKARFDGVRPFTAINIAFNELSLSPASAYSQASRGDSDPEIIRAWAGPGLGAQDMRPRDWRSYLRTDGHPEYPSGTTCLLHTWAEAARNRFGPNGYSDAFSYTQLFAAGSSVVEPGFTPATASTLTFTSLTDVATKSGESRLDGGQETLAPVPLTFQVSISEMQSRRLKHPAQPLVSSGQRNTGLS